ncbi:hypothetical protein GCM10010345_86460 [Streptomyces canarius]|uniref:Uncharacterized protein n=1 Tax=Streptomyces canarius TaxID=285453 RepID=A0ABQ3D9T3_9ACTN|nr:hypothetical protein GCM10010345_86460 [Streptomyces canarius]
MAELTTDGVVRGAGSGTPRIRAESDRIVCEVHDGGQPNDPLAGRRPPRPTQTSMPAVPRPERDSAAGLWLRRR